MFRTVVTGMVAATVGIMGIGGCADPRPADPAATTPSPSASSSPTDGPVSTTTAAQEAIGAFVSAAQILDADIAQTGLLLNGLFVTDGVRYVDSVTVAAMATLERVKDAATLIPAGLADEVRVAALQV